MPIPFPTLPDHIRDSVIQKTNLRDFVHFQEISRKAFEDAKNIKTRLTLEKEKDHRRENTTFVDPHRLKLFYSDQGIAILYRKPRSLILWKACYFNDFPLRIEGRTAFLSSNLSEEFCKALTNFLQNTHSSINVVNFVKIGCSVEALKQLVETKKVKELRFGKYVSPEYFKIEAIDKVSKIVSVFLEEDYILMLNASHSEIRSSNLTSAGANRILKELLEGRKRIKRCEIHTNLVLRKEVVMEGISFTAGPRVGLKEVFYVRSCCKRYKVELLHRNIVITEQPNTDVI